MLPSRTERIGGLNRPPFLLMATPAQILANRLNAQKSTGPRSAEGKAAARFNALKHAASAKSLIIPGEDESTLAELAASYNDQFQPQGPEEELLLQKIVTADWTQRRMHRLEAEVLNALIDEQDESEENPVGKAFIQDCQGPNALQKIFRCREAASREWYRALNELRDRQSHRIALAPALQPTQTRTPAPQPASSAHTPSPNPQVLTPGPQALTPCGPRPLAPSKIGFVFDDRTPPAWRL